MVQDGASFGLTSSKPQFFWISVPETRSARGRASGVLLYKYIYVCIPKRQTRPTAYMYMFICIHTLTHTHTHVCKH